jgi:adenylate cyclase class 2
METPMLEVEVKYRVSDFCPIEERLRKWGARSIEDRDDNDDYFNAPHRDFAQSDEALRIRRIGSHNAITYKGPRTDKHTKTRVEIEVPIASGDEAAHDLARLLSSLGFRSTASVRKHRSVYEFSRDGFTVQACLDRVEEVGTYVELEIMAEDSRFEPARDVVLKCAAELGLSTMERRSYLELLLEARKSA